VKDQKLKQLLFEDDCSMLHVG